MNPQQSATDDPLWWAGPQLKQQLARDPAAVLRDRGLNIPAELPPAIVHEFARVVCLLWLDGRIVPLDQFYIDPSDEGLLFGRGVWESTRTIGGVPWLWTAHLERLRRTAELLYIEFAPERLPNAEQVKEYVRALTAQDVVVRLNVTAGRPGKTGIVWMTAAPQPYPLSCIRLKTCRSPVEKGQPYLTMKTFQYATRLRIGQQATQTGFDTALLLDEAGNLLEASHANIFVRLPEGWATPAADGGLLPGTVRGYLLEKGPVPIRERMISQTLLGSIQEAFVTNSNVGIVPVTRIDEITLPIGSETQNLIRWLEPPAPSGVQYRFVDRGIIRR
jgi:branched-subunit amino acid aminotransferase/4-amino-4-deoxychorismate lyase